MRHAILILILAVVAPAIHAQTVSPVISEFGKKASGEFTATNNALTPQALTIEAMSFTVGADGKAVYRPLDSNVSLQLSEQSARLGPKASRTFYYTLRCSTMPCAVAFFSVFTGLRTTEGIVVAIHIPTSVYLCADKPKGCRARIRATWGAPQ